MIAGTSDPRLVMAFRAVAVAGACLSIGLFFEGGVVPGVSAAIGAGVAFANLYVLSRIVFAVAVPYVDAKENAGFVWGVIALGKMMVLFGGLWVLMTHHWVDPIPLVVGYGSLPIGIAIGAVVSDKTGPDPTP